MYAYGVGLSFFARVSLSSGVRALQDAQEDHFFNYIMVRLAGLRFTPAGGKIEISIETGRDESRVVVGDTGCGIPPQHIAKVFDRFYRVDSSRSSRGAGLGLALVKSIAELHGGSATITSNADHGTIVTLLFPDTSGSEQMSPQG